MSDQDQKTEQPTGKRLEEARESGQMPVSREASTWVTILGIVVFIAWLAPPMASQLAVILRSFIEMPHALALDDHNAQTVLFQTLSHVGLAIGAGFLILLAASLAGTLVQTGFFFSLDLLSPDISRLSLVRGLKKLFSASALAELVKSFGKLVLLGSIAYVVLSPVALQATHMEGLPLTEILGFLQRQALHLIIMLLLAFTIIVAGDVFFTRFQYIRNLRMSKAEVKDEFKQQEGDPMIKARLRQIRLDKARKRMMSQVPKADVVITNPTHYAIALQYDSAKSAAPVVLAKGINLIAQRIRELAEENKIPLVSNPPLARALFDTVEIDREIPTQHYRAVAEIISYVYRLKKRKF